MKWSLLIASRGPGSQALDCLAGADEGFEVTAAVSGLECQAELLARPYDAVVLDLDLPRGASEEVLVWLRGVRRPYCQPVVFVTGGAPGAELARRTGLPEAHCFRKPFPMDQLLGAVESALVGKFALLAAGRDLAPIPTGGPALIPDCGP